MTRGPLWKLGAEAITIFRSFTEIGLLSRFVNSVIIVLCSASISRDTRSGAARKQSSGQRRASNHFPQNANQSAGAAQKQLVSAALTQFPALNYYGAASW